jgi:hypothetical protein
MADVFAVLARDHEDVQALLAELEIGPTRATAVTRDQLTLRKRLTQKLIIEESRHEALEEMYFWPVVRGYHPAGDTLADEATRQEQRAKDMLASLDKLDAGEPEFEQLLGTFTRAAREHIRFEEIQVWPGMRAVLPAAFADDLGRKIAEAKKNAPTRPHPRIPPSPGLLKATAPAVAAADKARDAVTRRGSG